MKKRNGKRILAGFLALLLVSTSFAWDFGGADVAKAQETTSAITATEDSLNINFDNIDITELDDNGYTSTRFKSSTALVGEVNQKVSEHWFSGDGTDTPYGDADKTTITGKNIGLKSNDIADSESRTVMYTPCSYEDFTVSAEVYYGAYSGIVIGEKNVYPTTSDAASSVAVFFNGGRINIMGAVDRDSAKIMRGSKAAIANNGNEVGYKIFNNGSGDTIKSDAGNVYTLNVKKTGNHLIIWYSGGTGLITIKLTDSYRTGAIGIQSKGYDGDCGGFKSLSIEKVHATETHNLDNANITELDNLGYSATLNTTVVNNSVENAFFSGTFNSSGTLTSANEGLKGTTTGTSVSGLNIPYIYENFRLEAEVYSGQLIGVAVGNASSTPRTANMLSAFYNMNGGKIMLQMEGAYSGSWTRVGGAAGANNNNYQWRPTLNGSAPTDVRDTVYTLVLEVRDGKATIWMEGYDGYVTATLADTYVTEKIALIARHSSNDKGGIKGYTITNLDAGDTQNFDNVVLSNLDAAGYKARKDGGTLATVSDSELWFSGDSTNYSDSEQYKNIGLKPSNIDTTREILNTPHTFENFRLETDVYHGQVLGVKIGQEEKGTQVNGGTDTSGSVSIYINGEYLSLCGAINYATAEYNGVNAQTKTDGWIQYKPTGNSAKWNQARTLIIEVQDGVLSVAFADLSHTLRVKLDSSYQADSIAFFARRYDTASGSAGGGLKGYTLEKLPSANTGTTVDIAGYTDFDHVDTAALEAKGFTSTRFDRNNAYAVVGDVNQPVSNHWFAGSGSIPTYENTSIVESGNVGLKPNHTDADKTMTILNTPTVYENYRASLEVYWGASTGLVLGAKNVFPSGGTIDSSVRIYFNSSQTQIVGGGVNFATGAVSGGDGSSSIYEEETYIFKPGASYKATKGATYKLNVEVLDGILSVWVDGYDSIFNIQLADTFNNESVAIMARQYDVDAGGIKSFEIQELEGSNTGTTVDVDGYTDFDKVDVTILDEKGFSATQFDTSNSNAVVAADQIVSTYWFAGKAGRSANDGLKPKTVQNDSKMTILNTPYTAEAGYEDFRVSTEVYWGASTGIVLGAKNVLPRSTTDSAVQIFFNANQIQLTGAGIDPETAVVTGGASWNPNYLTTFIFKPDASFTVTKGSVYKLNVEMKDGVITVWVDGHEGSVTVKTTDTFKQESIALMARQYDGDGGGLKSLMVEKMTDVVVSYTAEEFATYRSADGYTAPTYKNYLFSGWFTDSACTKETAVSANTTSVNGTVYAKFVPRYVLDVKAQVSSHLLDNNLKDDTSGGIRFLTTIDSLAYSQVGFKVSYDKGDGKGVQNKTSASNKVYKSLFVTIGDKEGGAVEKDPTEFCDASILFKACTIKTVVEELYDMEFTVTPFWKTLDGTEVRGDAVVKTVDQGISAAYLKGKTALFLGDSIMKGAEDKPANDFNYLSWAGRLDRYYGMEVDKVAQSGWALTSDCPQSITSTTIRGQIATQLEQASMESYDYVMLEGGCNDVLTYTNGDQTVMNSKWGEIQTADDAVLDDTTIAGAMQELIVRAHAAYPNAKLVYIINSEYGLFDADQENIYHNEAKLAQMIKDVCMLYKEKGYDINYIDLSNTTVYPELVPLSKENARLYPDYTPDRLHPNAASYELSTPVIANFLREVGTGKLPEEVYVSSTGITTLNDAIDAVVDGGTVYIQDAYAVESTFAWEEHGKKVTIKGADATASLSFANVLNGTSTEINVKDDVIFSDITLGFTTSGNQYVMANGHDFIVKDDVTFTGNSIKLHGGGSGGLVVDSTRLELYAGNYTEIYGGGSSGTVNYDTNIIIGGDVNSHLNITEYNTASYLVFGGVRNGTVKGNTNITVEGNAKFYFIYGGSRDGGAVNGSTNITFSGNAYSIYGGSCKGTVDETHVEILGGNVYQVFGGCEKTSMTGTTDVQLLGGNVLRRVYGGCYNEYDSGWKSTNHVTGNTSVTIGPNVNFSFSDDDQGVFAGSRYSDAFDDEDGTVIFVDNCYDAKKSVLGSQDFAGSIVVGTPEYSYLVKATVGGNVYSAGNTIYVVPNSGYTATVTNKDGSALSPTEEGGAYYALADATSDTITVTFTASAE